MITHALIFSILIIGAAILLAAGPARILNVVDYKKIEDPKSLNRYASAVALIFAAISGAVGYIALKRPEYREILNLAYIPIILGLAITVTVGAEKFKKPRKMPDEA